jgi:bifunctional N-acetylglucosamine-1-phosphate-uridyltransferase/glucosamine-1-phosphate-acetyltransferase GlmU-like protein
MEEYKVVRIVNEEPEFWEGQRSNAQVDYFILCEEGDKLFGKNVYELEVCGINFVNWVARACAVRPRVINIRKNENVLEVVKSYINSDAEYSVVLYADTPLVNRAHILDLIEFVDRRRMNVCKLKRGFVFKNEYIKYNDEFYSIDEYDFASSDFVSVKNAEDFTEVKKVLTQKIIDFHKKNGVQFENENTVSIDANVQIGEKTKIASGVRISKGSILAENCVIDRNAKISGSTVGEKARVGDNSIIIDSIVKDNVFVGLDCIVKNSVVGNNIIIEMGSKVVSSSLKDGVIVKSFVIIDDGRLGEGVVVHKHSRIMGLTERVIIGAGSEIGANSEISDSKIADNRFIEVNSKISNKVED